MAQFRYRLEVLLEQKVRAKEVAQQALATAQQELRAAQEQLQVCIREQEASAERLGRARQEIVSPDVVRGCTGESMRSRREYVRRLEDEWNNASDAAIAQEFVVEDASDRVTEAREALASASRDVEVLEKHRERLERRFNEEAMRRDGLEQEEMANVIFSRRRKAT